jgi:hypothetical protein
MGTAAAGLSKSQVEPVPVDGLDFLVAFWVLPCNEIGMILD